MNLKWKQFIFRTFLFLTAEICLTPLGLDDLADYSEFLYERNENALILLGERHESIYA